MMTRQEAIDEYYKQNHYDPLSAGTWRQQVAVCLDVNNPLYPHRPVPRGFPINTPQEAAAIAALTAELDARDRANAQS